MQAVAEWQMQQGSAIQGALPVRAVMEAAEIQADVFLVAPSRRKATQVPQEDLGNEKGNPGASRGPGQWATRVPQEDLGNASSSLFDVVLMIPAHRVVLATRCEFLKASLLWAQQSGCSNSGISTGASGVVPLLTVPEADAEVVVLLQVREHVAFLFLPCIALPHLNKFSERTALPLFRIALNNTEASVGSFGAPHQRKGRRHRLPVWW